MLVLGADTRGGGLIAPATGPGPTSSVGGEQQSTQELSPTAHTDFGEDCFDMVLDRVGSDAKPFGQLPRAQTLDNQVQQRPLARREAPCLAQEFPYLARVGLLDDHYQQLSVITFQPGCVQRGPAPRAQLIQDADRLVSVDGRVQTDERGGNGGDGSREHANRAGREHDRHPVPGCRGLPPQAQISVQDQHARFGPAPRDLSLRLG